MSTEQFCGKEIIYFSLRSCGGFFVFLHNALCLPKQIFINDAGESIRNFLIPVCIYPYVSLVSQNAVNAVLVEFISVGCFDLIGIEIADNISHRLAAGVHLKNFLHDGSGVRVNLNMFLAVYTKAQRQIAACGKAFFGVDVHATPYLLREFDAVILCHSLQHGLHQPLVADSQRLVPGVLVRPKIHKALAQPVVELFQQFLFAGARQIFLSLAL